MSILSFEISGNDFTGESIFASKETLFSPRLEVSLRFSDNESPEIGSIFIDPANPSSEDVTIVSAKVSDTESGVKTVKLFYRIEDSLWTNLEMVLVDDIYQGTIPLQKSESIVEFYLLAEDNSENNSTSTIQEYKVVRPQYYNDLQNIYNNLLTRFDELTIRFDELKVKADLEKIDFDSLLNNYSSLQTIFKDIDESYIELQGDYNLIIDELNSIQFELAEVNNDLFSANSQKTSLQVELDNLKQEIELLESDLFGAKGELSGNREYLDSILTQLNNTQDALIDASNDLSNAEAELEDLTSEYNNVNQFLIFWQLITIVSLASVIGLLIVRRSKK
jgi:predicted  nucleic acid-binding Zn-ribbon protein